jgi:hypothetical protein
VWKLSIDGLVCLLSFRSAIIFVAMFYLALVVWAFCFSADFGFCVISCF